MRLIQIAALCAFAASTATAHDDNIASIKAALNVHASAGGLSKDVFVKKEVDVNKSGIEITAEKCVSIRKAFPDFPSFAAIQARLPANQKGRAAIPLSEVASLFPELSATLPSADAIRARIPAVGAPKDSGIVKPGKAGSNPRLPSVDGLGALGARVPSVGNVQLPTLGGGLPNLGSGLKVGDVQGTYDKIMEADHAMDEKLGIPTEKPLNFNGVLGGGRKLTEEQSRWARVKAKLDVHASVGGVEKDVKVKKEVAVGPQSIEITAEKCVSIRKAFPDFPSFPAIQARLPANQKGRAAVPLEEVIALFPELSATLPSADAIRARIPAVGTPKDKSVVKPGKAGSNPRLPSVDGLGALGSRIPAVGVPNLGSSLKVGDVQGTYDRVMEADHAIDEKLGIPTEKPLNFGGILGGRKLKDEATTEETDVDRPEETAEQETETAEVSEETAETEEDGGVKARVERVKQKVHQILHDDDEHEDSEEHEDAHETETAEETAEDVAEKVEGENRRLKDAVQKVQHLVHKAGKAKHGAVHALGDKVKKTLDHVGGRHLQAEPEKRSLLGAFSDLLSNFKLPSLANLQLPKLSGNGNGVKLPTVGGGNGVLSGLQNGNGLSTGNLQATYDKIMEADHALDEKLGIPTEKPLNFNGVLGGGRKLTGDDKDEKKVNAEEKGDDKSVKDKVHAAVQRVHEKVEAKKKHKQWEKSQKNKNKNEKNKNKKADKKDDLIKKAKSQDKE